MKRSYLSIVALVMLIFSAGIAHQDDWKADPAKVHVDIVLPKLAFRTGERISYHLYLTNEGSGFYIRKDFGLWFIDEVKQLTGLPPKIGCGHGGPDSVPLKENRNPETILREDYLWLGTGRTVGITSTYPDCMSAGLLNPGTYEIAARFYGPRVPDELLSDDALSKRKDLYPFKFLESEIQAKPVRFRIVGRSKQ